MAGELGWGGESSAAREGSYLAQTKRLLRQFGLRAKKGLAQHFLIDEEVLGKVISAAELSPSETVIEVGPGLGMLTRELAARAGRVIAIEVDAKLASALIQIVGACPNVTFINADVLELKPSEVLAGEGDGPLTRGYKVVANLPYYITAPVLRHFLEASPKPRRMVVMVQREVGENIAAKPGHSSLLSISVQLYGRPIIVDYVPAQSFYPPPKVDSAILRIDVYRQPAVEVKDVGRFFEIVRAGFSAPRKQLRNALSQALSLSPESASGLLKEAGISPQRRAQTLSLDEWAKLYQIFAERSAYPVKAR